MDYKPWVNGQRKGRARCPHRAVGASEAWGRRDEDTAPYHHRLYSILRTSQYLSRMTNRMVAIKLGSLCLLLVLCGCAQTRFTNPAAEAMPAPSVTTLAPAPPHPPSAPEPAETNPGVPTSDKSERVRAECIEKRRLICGRVLQVTPDGIVVDSGYVDLLRQPLSQSWLIPGSVSASRDPNVLELNTPGTPCVGLVFLGNIPRRNRVAIYDYVVLIGYPTGEYNYVPAPGIQKTIRMFSASLDRAVKLHLEAGAK